MKVCFLPESGHSHGKLRRSVYSHKRTFSAPPRQVSAEKLAALMQEAEDDVLTYMTFPKDHRTRLHSTNPLECLNKEIKRRTHVVGIFPNQNAIVRLVGALMLEQNDEWAVTRQYMTLETIDEVCKDQTVDVAKIATV